jgi:starch phosphorylase
MNTQERSTETRAFMHSLRSRISVDGEGLLDEPREAGEIRAEVSTYNRLWTLARNLWWTSQPEVTRLFRELARIRWRQLAHNPIALLSEFTLERLDQRVNELVLRSQINHAYRRLVEYLDSEATWGALPGGVLRVWPVAYF